MFRQQGFQSERVLDCLLHAGGAVGLTSIVLLAYWLTAGSPQEIAPANPGTGSATPSARLRTVHVELVDVENQLKAAEALVQEGSRRIPSESCESEFLRDIMQIAKETGLTIRDYQPAPSVTRADCRQLSIHLSGSADYRSICRFLDGVNRLPRLTTVERLEITAGPTATAYPIAVTVAVYFTGRTSAEGNSGTGKNG